MTLSSKGRQGCLTRLSSQRDYFRGAFRLETCGTGFGTKETVESAEGPPPLVGITEGEVGWNVEVD